MAKRSAAPRSRRPKAKGAISPTTADASLSELRALRLDDGRPGTVEAGANKLSPKYRGFMDLPAELRNCIYELALIQSTHDEPLTIRCRLDSPFCRNHRQLLGASRQIREEALPIYYARNYFTTNKKDSFLAGWLEYISNDAIRMLRSLIATSNCLDCTHSEESERAHFSVDRVCTGVGDSQTRTIVLRNSSRASRERCWSLNNEEWAAKHWKGRAEKLANRIAHLGGVNVGVENRFEIEWLK